MINYEQIQECFEVWKVHLKENSLEKIKYNFLLQKSQELEGLKANVKMMPRFNNDFDN